MKVIRLNRNDIHNANQLKPFIGVPFTVIHFARDTVTNILTVSKSQTSWCIIWHREPIGIYLLSQKARQMQMAKIMQPKKEHIFYPIQ